MYIANSRIQLPYTVNSEEEKQIVPTHCDEMKLGTNYTLHTLYITKNGKYFQNKKNDLLGPCGPETATGNWNTPRHTRVLMQSVVDITVDHG